MVASERTDDEHDDRPPVEPTVVVRTSRGQWAVAVGLTLAVGFLAYEQVSSRYDANVATSTAQDLAGPVADLCRNDPDAREQIGNARCDVASDVQREPSVAAMPRDGRDGRGIVSTALVGGHLLVTYTDGNHVDLGRVVGATGPGGPTGPTGVAGRGIVDAALDGDGRLVVTYTDGTSEAVGHVVGRDGVDGVNGVDGRGVDRVEARDGRLLVYYSTAPDQAVDVGPLPPGRGIETLDLDLDACTVTIHYTDQSSEVKSVTGCDSSTSEPTTTDDLPTPTG